MKIEYRAGSRKTFVEMDTESRKAAHEAISLVKDKKAIMAETKKTKCHLVVSFGHNIYTTDIWLCSTPGLVEAFYFDGAFYDVINKEKVALI